METERARLILRIRKLQRFLNLISLENSEFFEVEARFQTEDVGFENGPPVFSEKKLANEAARLHFTVRSTTSLKSRRLFFTSSPLPQ